MCCMIHLFTLSHWLKGLAVSRHFHPHRWTCALLFERSLPPDLVLLARLHFPPLPASHMTDKPPVPLRNREHCQLGQWHTRHINCMNDSKDFQDAESVRSGISHVTSQPGVFPKQLPFEGLLRPSFISQRHTDGPPSIWDTSGITGNVFCTSTSFLFSSVSSGIKCYLEENY